MSTQPIAANVSAPGPLDGQDSRSSQNFQFLEVPDSGNISVSMPDGISCALRRDATGSDPLIATISNGSTFTASNVNAKDDYYLASPTGASQNFVVTFSGNV